MPIMIITAADIENIEALITPIDMRCETIDAMRSGVETVVQYRTIPNYTDSSEALHLVYFPKSQRGGVCDGGNTQWTDCAGLDDLFDRYVNCEERWSN